MNNVFYEIDEELREQLAHVHLATKEARKLGDKIFDMMVEHYGVFGPCELQESTAQALAWFKLYLRDIYRDTESTDEDYIFGEFGLIQILHETAAHALRKRKEDASLNSTTLSGTAQNLKEVG